MTEQSSESTQAEDSAQSQADTQATDDSAPQAEAQQETISLDEAKKLRSEASSLRKRLKDAESKAQAVEEAGKTDEEKRASALKAAEERAVAAEQRLRDATARTAVYEAVGNSASPRAIYALIRDDLEFDDDDTPTNVAELIVREKKTDPTLFRATGGSGDGGRRSADTKPEFRTPQERMTYALEKMQAARR